MEVIWTVMYVPFSEWEYSDFLLAFPTRSEVSLCNRIHNTYVFLQSLGLKELGKQLSHLLGLFFGIGRLGGTREDLVDGVRPPGSYKLVLIGKQELVTRRAAEDGGRLPKKRGFEDFRWELGHAVEDELFRMAFPSGGQELKALADHGVPGFPRRKVGAGEVWSVLVKEGEEREGDEGDKEEEEGEVEMLHVFYCSCVVFVWERVLEGSMPMNVPFYRHFSFVIGWN